MLKRIFSLSILLLISSNSALANDPFNSIVEQTEAPTKVALSSTTVTVHYSKSTTMEKLVQSSGLLSKQGKVILVSPHRLAIEDSAARLRHIAHFIQQNDQPTPQVLIRAKIINIDNHHIHDLGVIFKTSQTDSQQTLFHLNGPAFSIDANRITIPIVALKDNTLLNMQITALAEEGFAKIIASPELITLNLQPAVIEAGEDIPYQEATLSGATSVAFKKASLRLQVTPDILPHHRLLLHLVVNQDQVSHLTINGVPAIKTQHIKTQVIVNNNQTFVLGGILEQINSSQTNGIIGLRKIPILGALFRQHKKTHENKQLMIFVTPKILTASSTH